MEGVKSQTAVEFIILLAALLIMFVPIFFILTDYGISTSSEIVSSQVNEIAANLVSEAREIYYLGMYNKEIVTVRMPDNINSMNALIINDSGSFEYYLIINYTKNGEFIVSNIPSEVPIVTAMPHPEYNCFVSAKCTDFDFAKADYSSGAKNFNIESIMYKGVQAVNITPVVW